MIDLIVIHASATANNKKLGNSKKSAAEVIDAWHKERGFRRLERFKELFNSHLSSIGYHFVIDIDGEITTGRSINEVGAHAKGYNKGSIGICLVGGLDESGKPSADFTPLQFKALKKLVLELKKRFKSAKVLGHRDLSPDLNNDGVITPNEYIKACPCFDVRQFFKGEGI